MPIYVHTYVIRRPAAEYATPKPYENLTRLSPRVRVWVSLFTGLDYWTAKWEVKGGAKPIAAAETRTGKSALNRVLGRQKGRLSSPQVSDDGSAVPEIYLGVQDEEILCETRLKQELKSLYGPASQAAANQSHSRFQ